MGPPNHLRMCVSLLVGIKPNSNLGLVIGFLCKLTTLGIIVHAIGIKTKCAMTSIYAHSNWSFGSDGLLQILLVSTGHIGIAFDLNLGLGLVIVTCSILSKQTPNKMINPVLQYKMISATTIQATKLIHL